jgi:hypothetical protein
MQVNVTNSGGFWLAPAALGGVLIGVGILIYVYPQILAYAVAGLFVLAGFGLLGLAFSVRRRVTIRRVDAAWPGEERRADDVLPE